MIMDIIVIPAVGRVSTVLYKLKKKSAIGKQIITPKECKEYRNYKAI